MSEFFAQLLYNHIGIEIRLVLAVSVEEKVEWVHSLFTTKDAFVQLVRAAEGNSRDFLCIFTRAFFDEYRHASKAKSKAISIPKRHQAARWYDTEKAPS